MMTSRSRLFPGGHAAERLGAALLLLLCVLSGPETARSQPVGICGRTAAVQEVILAALGDGTACADVTAAQLAGIDRLDIASKGLTALQSGDFAGLTGLDYLTLQSNSLSALPEDVFSGLANLSELHLSRNMLEALPADVFDGLASLTNLALFRNATLTALPADVFDGLTSLRYLTLSRSGLTTVPAGLFDGLENLEILQMTRMALQSLPPRAFDDLPSLKQLYLHTNALEALPADVFGTLPSLSSLSLDNNRLATLPSDVFRGLTSLERLTMRNNLLRTLPDGLLVGLANLTHLHIAGNHPDDVTFPVSLSHEGDTAGVEVAIGSPVPLTVTVSAEGGDLSPEVVTIPVGATESEPITVTRTGPGAVTLDVAALNPDLTCADSHDLEHCYTGFRFVYAPPAEPASLTEDEPRQRQPAIRIWTERLGYRPDEEIRVFLDVDPKEDEREYTLLLYRESIDTGDRLYLAPRTHSMALRDEVVDQYGRDEGTRRARALERIEKELVWEGRVSYPGRWHFVAELRSRGTTQVLKRAYAKFVVPSAGSFLVNRRGFERAVEGEMRLTSDRSYLLGGRLLVKSGATLTIEAGALVEAMGPAAEIVVEPGARIMVLGRREAPVVMTCSQQVGQRRPGCWGGLKVYGKAPVGDGQDAVTEARLDQSFDYFEDDPQESSGELRYLRVEFAGGGSVDKAPAAAVEFHGVGDGTVIDHVQAHSSLGDGFAFHGGTARCNYCVSSDSRHDSLAWDLGWQGSVQHLYVQQGSEAASAIRGSADGLPINGLAPTLYNVTLVGGYNISVLGGSPGRRTSIGPGILLEGNAAITARNVLAVGFGGFAVDGSAAGFASGTSSFSHAILTNSGYRRGSRSRVGGTFVPYVEFIDAEPDLLNIRYEANPDPRPRGGSPALRLGNAAVPPFDGRFDRSAHRVGAFGKKNWLEEWTFFGSEQDYEVPGG